MLRYQGYRFLALCRRIVVYPCGLRQVVSCEPDCTKEPSTSASGRFSKQEALFRVVPLIYLIRGDRRLSIGAHSCQ